MVRTRRQHDVFHKQSSDDTLKIKDELINPHRLNIMDDHRIYFFIFFVHFEVGDDTFMSFFSMEERLENDVVGKVVRLNTNKNTLDIVLNTRMKSGFCPSTFPRFRYNRKGLTYFIKHKSMYYEKLIFKKRVRRAKFKLPLSEK